MCLLVAIFKVSQQFFMWDNTLYLCNTFLLRSSKHFTTAHYLIHPHNHPLLGKEVSSITTTILQMGTLRQMERATCQDLRKSSSKMQYRNDAFLKIQILFQSLINDMPQICLTFWHYFIYKLACSNQIIIQHDLSSGCHEFS